MVNSKLMGVKDSEDSFWAVKGAIIWSNFTGNYDLSLYALGR